jgi:hypothetical protein
VRFRRGQALIRNAPATFFVVGWLRLCCATHGLGGFDDQFQFAILVILGDGVAFLSGSEAALRCDA